MALDLIYAMRTGLLPIQAGERILDILRRLGFVLYSPMLDLRLAGGERVVLEGLEEFREHLGGRLSIPMIRAPGDRLELHEMDTMQVDAAIDELKSRHG
jgi:3-dehydroquinate synthase